MRAETLGEINKKGEVLPRLELGSKDSESLVMTNYTTGPPDTSYLAQFVKRICQNRKSKNKKVCEVLPGLEPGSKDSESLVMTNYTTGPRPHGADLHLYTNTPRFRTTHAQEHIPIANAQNNLE